MAKIAFRETIDRDSDNSKIRPRLFVLATQAADQAALLSVMVEAYVALEKLISHEQDTLERVTVRESLSILMRSLNGEARRQVQALVLSTNALYALAADEAGANQVT